MDGEGPGIWVSREDSELEELVKSIKIKIKVVGVGGGGCNTLKRIAEKGIQDVELIAANTDAEQLHNINVQNKILLGKTVTRGRGTGSDPRLGLEGAREAEARIGEALEKPNIVFIAAGLGGGTGTGAAPFVARMARDRGALVIGIVTLPFRAEGEARMQNATEGLELLERACDTTILVPNDRLLSLVPDLPLNDAFKVADEILLTAIRTISDMITKVGMVNLDFNDLQTIMKGGGVAMIGIGESTNGFDMVHDAVNGALKSPLLYIDITEAKKALIYVMGGTEMTIKDAEEAAELVTNQINPDATLIWGCDVDPTYDNLFRVLVVLTGMDSDDSLQAPVAKPDGEDDFGIDFVD
jgi:cell division protein FtsZ